jgi:hypothetical protein
MASTKKKPEPTDENPEIEELENSIAEGEPGEKDPADGGAVVGEVSEDQPEPTDEKQETASIAKLTAIKATGIHERLEDLELAMITAGPDKGWALNRITLLTGSLKTALPDAIRHVDDLALKADLEALLGLL